MSVAENLARIRETLSAQPVTLVAVTKRASLSQIEEAIENGVTEFGENRLQDALKKIEALPEELTAKANWHFIGHLQTNKVKRAVGRFALIHSVDSLRLAEEISIESCQKNFVQPVLIQVKILKDDTKSGYSIDQLRKEFAAIVNLPGIEVRGLMTISPLTDDRAIWRRCFNGLRELRDELRRTHSVELRELSMGMTADWQDAVDCGATMVRLGQAIFG